MIAIIEGTVREKRKSIHAAKLIYEASKEYEEIEPVFLDPKDFDFPGDGNDPESKDPRFSGQMP